MARTTIAPGTVWSYGIRFLSTSTMTLFALLAFATAPAFAAPAAPDGPDTVTIPENDPCWELGNCPVPDPDPEDCDPGDADCGDPEIEVDPCLLWPALELPLPEHCDPGEGPDDGPEEEPEGGPDDEPEGEPTNEPEDEPEGDSSTGIPTPTRIDTGSGGSVDGSSLAWWLAAAGAGTAAGVVGARRYVATRGQR